MAASVDGLAQLFTPGGTDLGRTGWLAVTQHRAGGGAGPACAAHALHRYRA